MEISYQVTPDDFVGFNLSFMSHAKQMRASIRTTQVMSAVLILGIGTFLMFLKGGFSAPWMVAYIAIAAVAFFLIPGVIRRRVRKGVYKTLSLPQNKHVCSDKTLTLEDGELHLTGGGEDSRYTYDKVEKIEEDTERYYIYVGPMSAVIVPFSAFTDGEHKGAFYAALCSRVEEGGGRVRG